MLECSVSFFEGFSEQKFSPLTQTKPFLDLRCGSRTLRNHWIACGFAHFDSPIFPKILVHTGLFPDVSFLERTLSLEKKSAFFSGDRCVLVFFPKKGDVCDLGSNLSKSFFIEKGFDIGRFDGFLIETLIDLLSINPLCLPKKCFSKMSRSIPSQIDLYGDPSLLSLGKDLQIYGQILVNVENGPVIIEDSVKLTAPVLIEGPCFIGKNTSLSCAQLRSSVIGSHCKISGEVTASVFDSHSNKAHCGFVGHSYVSSWVNIGAMSATSNMKNTYGTIRYRNSSGKSDSLKVFLGSFIGSYVTLGLGTLLNAGTIVETGVNFLGGELAPKYLPSFVWGKSGEWKEYSLTKMLKVFTKMKKRRSERFSHEEEALLRELFNRTRERREFFLCEQRVSA